MTTCDFCSGLFAGFMNLIVGHPFDTIKLNQQKDNTPLLATIQSINQTHGARGFFRGLGFPLLASGVVNSVFFGTYESVLNKFTTGSDLKYTVSVDDLTIKKMKVENLTVFGKRHRTYMDCFFAGCAAGVTQTIVGCPVEVVKINLQATTTGGRSFTGPFDVLKYLIKSKGVGELYRGCGSMLLRDIPGSGVYMISYTYFSDLVQQINAKNGIDKPSAVQQFMAGGMAGLFSWWAIIPIDVVKSKLQSDDPHNPLYKGVKDCTIQIWRTQGIRGFFSGFVALSIRAFPVNGATFLVYEWFSKFCRITCQDPTGKCSRYLSAGTDPDEDDATPW